MGRKRVGEPVRTKQDRHGIRERLLRSGAELFAAHGLRATQVSDVARHADVSVGAFYRYFRDKDELFRELVRARFDAYLEMLRGLERGLVATTLHERVDVLRTVFQRTYEMHLAEPNAFLVWYRHGHGVSDEASAFVTDFVREVEELLVGLLDRTITVGDRFDASTRRLMATSMLGMAHTVAYRMVTTGEPSVEHATEVSTRIAAGGLLALAPAELQAGLLSLYQEELSASAGDPSETVAAAK